MTYYSGPLLSGEVVDFDIQVRNTGDLPVQGASVVLYDGNPAAGGVEVARRVLGDWFEGGTSVTVTLSWTVPEPVSAHTLYAIVDADAAVTEFNEYNNQQWVTLGGTDLSPMELVASSAQVDGTARLVVRVRNAGGPESPVATLGVRPAGGGGAALATAAIPALAAGTSAEVAVDLPAGSVPPETAVKFDIRTDDAGAVEDVNRDNDLLTAEVTGAVDESPAVATTVEVVTDLDEIPVAEAGTTVFHVWLSAMPSAPVSLAVSAVAGGDADLTVSNGATFTIQPSAWNTPVAVTLAAVADGDSENGTTQFQVAESGSTVGVWRNRFWRWRWTTTPECRGRNAGDQHDVERHDKGLRDHLAVGDSDRGNPDDRARRAGAARRESGFHGDQGERDAGGLGRGFPVLHACGILQQLAVQRHRCPQWRERATEPLFAAVHRAQLHGHVPVVGDCDLDRGEYPSGEGLFV